MVRLRGKGWPFSFTVTLALVLLFLVPLLFVLLPPVPASHLVDPVPRGLDVVGTGLMDQYEAPLAGVSVHGDFAFVGGHSPGYYTSDNIGVRIVDLSDPSNPTLVGRIPLRDRGAFGGESVGDAVATHVMSDTFQGDIAIVLNGVPDSFSPEEYPQPYGVWDVTNPRSPQFLSILDVGYQAGGHEGGDLGDKPPDSKAVAGNYFYAIFDRTPNVGDHGPREDHGVAVVDLSDPQTPVVVGEWRVDPQVVLPGLAVNERGTRVYVTGISPPPWGRGATHGHVYVLDVQDPESPTEIGQYIFPLRGLISSVSKAAPNADDSLVVLADHSWEETKCGILTILDTSNLSTIHEISRFALPESDDIDCPVATDVAIEGTLVSSTWMMGEGAGVSLIDISDPRRPVQVGEFRGPQLFALSDVAAKDDLVIATNAWYSGLYVLRKTAETPTVVIDETDSPRGSVNTWASTGFHVSWEWPDGTRETAWDGFLGVEGIEYDIGEDGWVYVDTRSRRPWPVERVDLNVTGVYSWGVTTHVMEAEPAYVIFDRVQVYLTAPERVDVGSSIGWSAFYEYDGQPFPGEVTIAGESGRVGKFVHTVTAISDPLYGIEAFTANQIEVIFDRVDVTLEVGTPDVAVGDTAQILIMAAYAYDGSPFEGTLALSTDLTQREAGTYTYTVVTIADERYGLTAFTSNSVGVVFYVPPFYVQLSFYLVILPLATALGVAVFLWRRRIRRNQAGGARVDTIRL